MKLSVSASSAVVVLIVALTIVLPVSADAFTVTIKLTTGQRLTKEVTPETTGSEIKKYVASVISLQTGNQLLYKGDREITDAMTMDAADVSDGDELTVKRGTASPVSNKSMNIGLIIFIVLLIVGGASVAWAVVTKYRKMEYR